jgi:hypothetical protein
MLKYVADQYEERQKTQHERILRLSPGQITEFSVACQSQHELDVQLAAMGTEMLVIKPCMQWKWHIRQQTSYLILLALQSQPVLHQAWVVTRQSTDMIELQTVERYTHTTPRLYLHEHLKWHVSHNACKPPGLLIRRYRCPAVKHDKSRDLIEHFSPWFIHAQGLDQIILRTIAWARRQPVLVGRHRMPQHAPTRPNSPRFF